MSRIGKMPVPVPSGVNVTLSGQSVTVKGPKGQLQVSVPEPIQVQQDGDTLLVTRPDDTKKNRSLHGLSRTLVNNLVVGVTEGFKKQLEIRGVGYKGVMQGNKLVVTIGFSHPVEFEIPKGITVEVGKGNIVTISGIDKQQVGEIAAQIRRIRKPSVYSGKGIRYVDEYVRRKVGKAAATGAA